MSVSVLVCCCATPGMCPLVLRFIFVQHCFQPLQQFGFLHFLMRVLHRHSPCVSDCASVIAIPIVCHCWNHTPSDPEGSSVWCMFVKLHIFLCGFTYLLLLSVKRISFVDNHRFAHKMVVNHCKNILSSSSSSAPVNGSKLKILEHPSLFQSAETWSPRGCLLSFVNTAYLRIWRHFCQVSALPLTFNSLGWLASCCFNCSPKFLAKLLTPRYKWLKLFVTKVYW